MTTWIADGSTGRCLFEGYVLTRMAGPRRAGRVDGGGRGAGTAIARTGARGAPYVRAGLADAAPGR